MVLPRFGYSVIFRRLIIIWRGKLRHGFLPVASVFTVSQASQVFREAAAAVPNPRRRQSDGYLYDRLINGIKTPAGCSPGFCTLTSVPCRLWFIHCDLHQGAVAGAASLHGWRHVDSSTHLLRGGLIPALFLVLQTEQSSAFDKRDFLSSLFSQPAKHKRWLRRRLACASILPGSRQTLLDFVRFILYPDR